MFHPDIFKAYDIRGIYGKDLDDQFAFDLGLAYVAARKDEPDFRGKELSEVQIVVGSDMRLSSPALKEKLIQGLVAAGVKVVDIGLVSTPTFYFAVAYYGYQGGIMVSASHNPGEWNGFKVVRSQARPFSGNSGLEIVKSLINSGSLSPAAILGGVIKNDRVLDDELEYNLRLVDISQVKSLKVVADSANGMGAQYLTKLFGRLPGELISMNFDFDGRFPAHEADPLKEENIKPLADKVLALGADLGIATDGDGDRVFFVDDEGKTIPPALVRGLLAKIFLQDKPGSKIAYDARPGRITSDLIKEHGGIPVLTRVGHSLIKEQMLKEGIYFAGESSGHFCINLEIGCMEMPMLMIAKMLVDFSQSGQKISDYLRPYEKYFASGEINSAVADKEAVFARLKEKYSDGELSELDGLSVTYPDFWFNVRASNTENKFRLNLEAVSREIMEKKRDEVLAVIRA